MSHGAVMRLPGTQGPPAPAPGTAATAAAAAARTAAGGERPRPPGSHGTRPPPFSASFCRGPPAEPPEPGRAGRRLWARCCAASPASGCAGAAGCPPGRCPRPCRPRATAACRPPPACRRAPSAVTCRARTVPTAACTAGRTWPATRSSSPRCHRHPGAGWAPSLVCCDSGSPPRRVPRGVLGQRDTSPCPQSAEFLPTVPQVSPCGVPRVVSAPPVVSRDEDVPTVASIAPRQEASSPPHPLPPPWRGVLAVAGDPYGAPTEVTVLPSLSPSWQVSPCGVPRPVAVQRDGSRTWREGCRGRGTPPVTLAVSPQSFQGSHGRAYLFNSVVNVGCGPAEQRLLLTGLHSVADIFCQSCNTTLGWKYEQAFESSQKYKEGKFIIEMSHMVKENGWD